MTTSDQSRPRDRGQAAAPRAGVDGDGERHLSTDPEAPGGALDGPIDAPVEAGVAAAEGPPRRRIAIIGSGISALCAAHELRPYADVTLFERDTFRGGHSYTSTVEVEGRALRVDVGVQVVRPDTTPGLFALREADPRFVGLRLSEIELSLASRVDEGGRVIRYTNRPEDQLAPPFAADWAHLQAECARFEALTAEVSDELRMTRIADWAEAHRFSDEFLRGALVPSMSIVNVTRNGLLDGLFVTNLELPSALVGLQRPRTWYGFDDGVESFREVLTRGLEDRFELGEEIVALGGLEGGGVSLTIRRRDGSIERRDFDVAIWSGDLPCARAALDHAENPSRARHLEALAPFETEPALVYIHRDTSWLPEGIPLHALAIFHDREGARTMHYNPNQSQGLGLGAPLWISLCHEAPAQEPAGMVHDPIRWTHPHASPRIFMAQRELKDIQGLDGIWFCGAGTVIDGFDSCMVSGIEIARRIEARIPKPYAGDTALQRGARQAYDDMVNVWMFPPE